MLIYMNASHHLVQQISPNCKISARNHKIIKKIDTLLAEIAMLLFLCFAAADRPLLSRLGRTCFTDVLDIVLRWCCTLDPGAWGGRPWRRPGSWLFPGARGGRHHTTIGLGLGSVLACCAPRCGGRRAADPCGSHPHASYHHRPLGPWWWCKVASDWRHWR